MIYSSAVWSPEYICAGKDFRMPLKTMGSRTFQICLLGSHVHMEDEEARRFCRSLALCCLLTHGSGWWIRTAYNGKTSFWLLFFFFPIVIICSIYCNEHHHCHWRCIGQFYHQSLYTFDNTQHTMMNHIYSSTVESSK